MCIWNKILLQKISKSIPVLAKQTHRIVPHYKCPPLAYFLLPYKVLCSFLLSVSSYLYFYYVKTKNNFMRALVISQKWQHCHKYPPVHCCHSPASYFQRSTKAQVSHVSTPRVRQDILAGSAHPINLHPVYYPRVARDMTSSLLMPPPPPPPIETILGTRVREDPSESSMKRQRSCSPQGLYPLTHLPSLSRCGQTWWSSGDDAVANLCCMLITCFTHFLPPFDIILSLRKASCWFSSLLQPSSTWYNFLSILQYQACFLKV